MIYFENEFLEFFKELAANNNRDWFTANKKRYEQKVKEPFRAFVDEVLQRAKKDDNSIQMRPEQAIFRIHRDVRFSQDKSPYKLFCSAIIKPGTSRDMEMPGFYFELGPEHCGFYGGSYMPTKDKLEAIRQSITKDPEALSILLNKDDFKTCYGATLQGEQNQRLPKNFQAVREQQPLIANKQFYYTASLDAEIIMREDFMDTFQQYYNAGRAVNRWLQQAMVFGADV